MTEKTRIIDALGEPGLLFPAQLTAALAATGRIKYYLSLLQAAALHARKPASPAATLSSERLSAGIDDESLDTLPSRSTDLGDGLFHIPNAEILCGHVASALETLFTPIRASGHASSATLAARFAVLHAQAWCDSSDQISRAQLSRLSSTDRDAGDSAHLLMLDMHKILGRLQAGIASEDIDGAIAYDIEPTDHPLVTAFMRGVNATRPLKFDHPGLGTTAVRSNGRLVLQSDIGTSDTHLLVVRVEQRCVTLTYTDVHMQRLIFFQSLFEHWAVGWDDTRSRSDPDGDDGVHHLCTGKFTANNEAGLSDYLSFLGSRLVFLIDWNRARKRLRLLLPKKESLALLKWAADENVGHLGWLQAGGEQLVFDALTFAAQTPPTFGARLDDLLERSRATAFMQFVLRTCSQARQDGMPDDAILECIRKELLACFRQARHQLIDIAAEHTSLSIEIATTLHDSLLELQAGGTVEDIAATGSRAREWARRADELVNLARELSHNGDGHHDFYCTLIEQADNITDELEEATFHLTLLQTSPRSVALLDGLCSLAGLTVSGVRAFLKAVDAAHSVQRGAPREEQRDALEAIQPIVAVERHCENAYRSFKRALIRCDEDDFATRYAASECARNLNTAADALLRAALRLRDHLAAPLKND